MKIKINVEPADQIATLYDIGVNLAERIVKHRENYGFFYGPEDLAKVDGIGLELSIMLSPLIDWQIPSIYQKEIKRDWLYGVIYLILFIVLARLTYSRVCNFFVFLRYKLASPYFRGWIWIEMSIILSQFFASLASAMGILIALSRNFSHVQRLSRVATYFVFLFFLGAVSSGSAHIAYYQVSPPAGWSSLLNNFSSISIVIFFSVSIINYMPIILTLWFPKIGYNPKVAKLFDISTLMLSPAFAWAIWSVRELLPVWAFIFLLFLGGVSIEIGIKSLQSSTSYYVSITRLLQIPEAVYRRVEVSRWLKWVNERLPDPDDQKALKQSLDEAYPPSRIKTTVNLVIIGVGSWLVITALEAIIEFFIQIWLANFF